jgi:ubiquinol-cytochrome c reductase iron-sulfur subunit
MTERPAPPTRRDFLSVSTATFATVGAAVAMWPLIDQMNPNPSTPPGSILVDLAPIRVGQEITVLWRGQPVFVRHRTPDEIARARGPLDGLIDPYARNAALSTNATASDANRTLARHPEWLVVIGICTHLGCKLIGDPVAPEGRGEGWFCPCHAARFDVSGRVRSGPARTNLAVPPYRFIGPSTLEIGRT